LTELNFGTVVNRVIVDIAFQVTLRLEQRGQLAGFDATARAELTRFHRVMLVDALGNALCEELERQGRGEELKKILGHNPRLLETYLEVIWPNSRSFLLDTLGQATQRLLE